MTAEETEYRARLDGMLSPRFQNLTEKAATFFAAELDAARAELAAKDAEIVRLKTLLKPFARGHDYFDEEFSDRADRDAKPLNTYDMERSATCGDCRRAAEAVKA